MSRIAVLAVVAYFASFAPALAACANQSLILDFPCSQFLSTSRESGSAQFMVEFVRLGVRYHWFSENTSDIDFTIISPDAQVQYVIDHCNAHPSDHYSTAYRDLLDHMKALTAKKGGARPAMSDSYDLEAPADIRAHILAEALPTARTQSGLAQDDRPDLAPGLNWKLAKTTDGEIARVPDFLAIAFNDTGATLPEFGPNMKILAVVYPRMQKHDLPPSGDEDHDTKDNIPAFYIGSRGRDVWEIGKKAGVVSIRMVSDEGVGPWEPFQKDPSKYRYYAEHFFDGRTAADDFADPKVARLTLAACNGDINAMSQALKDGADPNRKGRNGDTPLFWALDCNNLAGVEALLKAGADPNYRVPRQIYPLPDEWQHFGGPTTRETTSYSVLYTAIHNHMYSAVRLLLEHGADPSVSDDELVIFSTLVIGLTDRQWDKRKGDFPNWDLRKALLDADMNIANGCKSEDVVDEFAVSGKYDLVEEFLKRGYNCELPDLAWAAGSFRRGVTVDDAARLRVNDILKQRGVAFPPHSRIERWASVTMQDDASLLVHWGALHSQHGLIEPDQVINKDDPQYDTLIARVGGIKRGEKKDIVRQPGDARD